MMGNILVEGITSVLAVDTPVVSPGTSVTLVVNSSVNLIAAIKKTVLKSDMEGQSFVGGVSYTTPSFPTSGTLSWDGVLSGSQESNKLIKDNNNVIVDDTMSGVVEWTVVTPATNPNPPASDVAGTNYPGTWSISTAGQDKLWTNE